ncbi:glycoside hydrolase family 3 C-terminal domain-containing protein [Flavobacterium rhizosphaerae]|uniref:Glycoside hydrolase family 3 C-terminal domain-containing protein n=1 Tax=Flavobacterium rhizosphaerae TaxID=3163298 RepID=A0ABW8YUM7_9FLAO
MNFSKKYTAKLLFSIFVLSPVWLQAQEKKAPQLGKATVKEVIDAMTLEEKVKVLVGTGKAPKPKTPPGVSSGWVPEPTMIGHTEKKVPGAAGNSCEIDCLGIPSLTFADGPAGVRISPKRKGDTINTYYATAWPVGTMLASTWNTELVEEVGRAFGDEVKEYGVDVLLSPGVNIHRNPRNGRNFEYYSEDPLVAGKIAAAFINGIQFNEVGTSIKHFVANNQETNRNYVSSTISERALREIYLKPFEIAVKEAQPWTVMSSYNRVNGKYTAQSTDLLTTVLRDEWGFKGFVITDWGGGYNWVEEMQAGNDMIMPGRPDQIETLINAVKHDSLKESVLDRNLEHIFNVMLKTPTLKKYEYSDKPDLKAHAKIAYNAATEGMVLLKNENAALPVNKSIKNVAAFGWGTYNTLTGGTGSGEVNKAYVNSVYKGLTDAGFKADESLRALYESKQPLKGAIIDAAAIENDIAIITIARISGEGYDRSIEDNYMLTDDEKDEIKQIADAFHAKGKKVIAVLNIGGVIDMQGWQNFADAILLAWQPGQEAGNSITDVLTGKVNPSGKLVTTFPVKYSDVPSAENFPGQPAERPEFVLYEEGVYVGYRYYDSFNIKPMYEFGYGLSYTNFDISGLKISKKEVNGNLTVTVTATVKNTGNVAGKEVAQIYISAPDSTIDKPEQELKAFGKTRLLKPGESEQLTFVITAKDLASYHTDSSEWIADAGDYTVKVGTSSRNIKIKNTFTLSKPIVAEKDHPLRKPDVKFTELKHSK